MATTDSVPPLLRLSPDVRRAIYDAAGLWIDRFINLTIRPDTAYDNYQWRHYPNYAPSRPFGRPGVTRSLLLTCRYISNEVSAILFGTCAFFVHFRSTSSLRALRQLRPSSLRSLTSLTVHLNVLSCHFGYACNGDRHGALDAPLLRSSPVLKEWRDTWDTHIRPYLTSGRLQLHLVCDCGDYEAARQAVEPFLELEVSNPALLLQHCSVRLSRRSDETLQHLAKRAVHTATTGRRLVDNESPFRFMDLPEEVRFRILTYTDLVTPLSETEWSWPGGYRFRWTRPVEKWLSHDATGLHGYYHQDSVMQYRRSLHETHWHWGYLDSHISCRDHHACQFRACNEFSRTDGGCFCHRYHAAFSSKYPCQCWTPPTPLFLVCRSFRHTASEVFFKRNRMVVLPLGDPRQTVDVAPARLPISRFLTETVPRNALRYIRFLEIVFPPFGRDEPLDYLAVHSRAWCDWRASLHTVKDDLNFSALTLRVYFVNALYRGYDETSYYRWHMTEAHASAILKTSVAIIRPVWEEWRVERAFVHLAWPFHCSDKWLEHFMVNREEALACRREINLPIEQRLERFIVESSSMDSGFVYDALALGKETERKSQWVWAHEMDGVIDY